MTKYVVELAAKHVLKMSPKRASRLGNVCKWVVGIATSDMGGLARDYITDMLVENVVEAATENGLDVILDNATTEEVGEGGRVDADDDTDKFLNSKC